MMDFTLNTYRKLLIELINNGYSFQSFINFLNNPLKKTIILRHDVDRSPKNSLPMAKIENQLGIESTYYFQIHPKIYNLEIVKMIVDLGHEIGYHYNDIEMVLKNIKPNRINLHDEISIIEDGYESFLKNLKKMRENFKIDTICMHGSPRSIKDNRILWKKHDYRNLEIKGEPYYDISWENTAYLTDSGRCWNGKKFIVRDKVSSNYDFDFHSTYEILANISLLPDHVMINTHPQRWSNNLLIWSKELIFQNVKNWIKKKYYVNRVIL